METQLSTEKICLYVIECSLTIDKEKLREKVIEIKIFSQFKLQAIINSITENFETSKKIRIFNFFGFEILDDSDLVNYKQSLDHHGIIFFTKANEFFENKNILRALKVKKRLGEGGFGKVYLAEQKYTQKYFAIKYFKYSSSSIKDVNFLYKEIEALRKLDYNHVIKLYTYCILEDDKIALVLEYAEGGTLREYLRERKELSESECRVIFKQILESVNYCHQKNIVHRDLKLENIVFTDKLKTHIKIIDFGVSSLFKGEKSKAGSIKYMAPEVITGANTESHPNIDIWSLGCILYELLTGTVMFQGNNEEIKEKITKAKFVIPEIISNEASHLINSMVRIKPVERLSIKDCLEHPWIVEQIFKEGEINYLKDKREAAKVRNALHSNKRYERLTGSFDFHNSAVNNTQESEYKEREKDKDFNQNNHNFTHNNRNFSSQVKRSMIRSKTTMKKEMKELPSLLTKIPTDLKESAVYDYNFALMRQYHGNIPNFLQPIGHNKQQKQKMNKMMNFMKKYFEMIIPAGENKTEGSNNKDTKDNSDQSPKVDYNSEPEDVKSNIKARSCANVVPNANLRNPSKKKFQTQINNLPNVSKIKSMSKSPILDILKNKKNKESQTARNNGNKVSNHLSAVTYSSNFKETSSSITTPKNYQIKAFTSRDKNNPNSTSQTAKLKMSPIFRYITNKSPDEGKNKNPVTISQNTVQSLNINSNAVSPTEKRGK